jgi:hypothetical protein
VLEVIEAIDWDNSIQFLWLYSPIQALPASMKLSVPLQLLDLGKSVGLLGREISSSQGLYLYSNRKKRTHKPTLNIHALSGIGTDGLGVRASEDSSCLRPLGYRDRQIEWERFWKIYFLHTTFILASIKSGCYE